MQFFAVGNYQGGNQQWGYVNNFRIYTGTHSPDQLPQPAPAPELLVSVDALNGEIVFGGSASYSGSVTGSPSIVEGPSGYSDGMLFGGGGDSARLGDGGVDTDGSWTIDCYFKTPIPGTGAWHTLTRGNGGDHQVILHPDQTSLGSYDNVGGSGFQDTGFDVASLDDGWHRLTVAAGGGTATFYIDGEAVGDHATVSTSDFFAVGNYQGGNQQWGYLHQFRIYSGTNAPGELPAARAPAEVLASIDVADGELVFGGSASYSGLVLGAPSIVEGPFGEQNAILFGGGGDSARLGAGVDTDGSWTIDTYFQTPIPGTGAWHTLTRGAGGDHQVIIHPDQTSLGSYDNVGGSGFSDTGFDVASLDDGWHRLTVAAGSGAATFYIDGEEVGSHSTVSSSDVSHYLAKPHHGSTYSTPCATL